jgi:predicted nucleic acid-binding protein
MDSLAFLPRDALHLTTMDRCGADVIVTTNDDFLVVDGLGLFTCNPHLLSQR